MGTRQQTAEPTTHLTIARTQFFAVGEEAVDGPLQRHGHLLLYDVQLVLLLLLALFLPSRHASDGQWEEHGAFAREDATRELEEEGRARVVLLRDVQILVLNERLTRDGERVAFRSRTSSRLREAQSASAVSSLGIASP